ncbi:hypothetical protein V6N11_024352 [Hibiscus sabdariffa]|uniref:RNase H type-1 domain-containing protein n=1 Tax=Hibiscus sabdariffa TaxID=183260 RepID=A0ABR1ZU44_9ROSI
MVQNYEPRSHSLIIITVWSLWYARNKLTHEGIAKRVEDVTNFVLSYCHELARISTSFSHPSRHGQDCWIAPIVSAIKINTDASFNGPGRLSSSGIIIRDYDALILGCCHCVNHNITSVFFAKAMAVLQGIQFAIDLGLQRVVMESVNKSVISKLLSTDFDMSEIGQITRDIKEMTANFVECRFTFSGRQSNAPAHALAAEGLRLCTDRYWVEEAPPFVDRLAAQDRRSQEPP